MPKTSTIPNIDLGGKVAVIDASGDKPRWRVIGRCYATKANAQKIMEQHGLQAAWLIDDLGYKELITRN